MISYFRFFFLTKSDKKAVFMRKELSDIRY
jgi:hypothetical protein